jgi:hypothetical protein
MLKDLLATIDLAVVLKTTFEHYRELKRERQERTAPTG